MTRKSKRELTAALDDVDGAPSTPRQWVRRHLNTRLEDGFTLDFPESDTTDAETVCILDAERFEFYVPREDVPEWLDPDVDLPVEGGLV